LAAEMRFEHEFTVEVPLEDAWRMLADADALAAALPNAELHTVDGVHTGHIHLDPDRNLSCEATISGVDQDEDQHVATVSAHGRQVEGPAIGSVMLRSRLSNQGSATAVSLTAEVLTTGHEPGNGFQAGAQRMFEAVARGLERRARERPRPVVALPTPPAGAARAPADMPASSRLVARGSWLEGASPQKRLAAGAAGLVITAAVLGRMRRGRRRRF
jgi:uncharacterized protein